MSAVAERASGPGDEELVRRVRAGDDRAFAVLVERHGPLVHRVARRIVGPQEAEDVAQDAFLRAYHRLGQYTGEGAFAAWLLRITRNTALHALERRAARPVAADDGDEAVAGLPAPGTPADALQSRERIERLEAKLRLLRDEHRVVLVLRDVEGLSYADVAAITDAPIGSVKGRLHRARGELIELLRRNTYDWELPA